MTQTRYRATFTPQAWIRDYAVDVDPEGETEWDCTETLLSIADHAAKNPLHPSGAKHATDYTLAAIDASIRTGGDFVDRDDVLADDPNAPEWVRQWRGPFVITVDFGE